MSPDATDLAMLEERVRQLEQSPSARRSHFGGLHSRTRRILLVIALALAVAVLPAIALASHQYADVSTSNPFHGDIDAITDAGITSGCGGGNYCPSLYVTREQMAAFLNRLGALAANKTPVVNATKLDGLDSGAFLQARVYRANTQLLIPSSGAATKTLSCDTGDLAISGGYFNILLGTHVYGDYPEISGQAWTWYVTNASTGYAYNASMFLTCHDLPPYR